MSWYNPFPLFRRNQQEIPIFCDNPNCCLEILDETASYDRIRKKVYHDNKCYIESIKSEHEQTGQIIRFSRMEHINRAMALKLLSRGKLLQSKSLDAKSESN